jgi:hypothetical protein
MRQTQERESGGKLMHAGTQAPGLYKSFGDFQRVSVVHSSEPRLSMHLAFAFAAAVELSADVPIVSPRLLRYQGVESDCPYTATFH